MNNNNDYKAAKEMCLCMSINIPWRYGNKTYLIVIGENELFPKGTLDPRHIYYMRIICQRKWCLYKIGKLMMRNQVTQLLNISQ